MHPPRPLSLILVILFALPVHPFSCKFTDSSVDYDITPLAGLHQANKQTSTPPTTSEAVVLMDLCGDSGVSREDGIPDEDQCPSNTRVCVKLLNHKSSSSDPDRVTAVIPLWPMDLAEGNIWITPMGKDGGEGFKIWVEGKEYSGAHQHFNLTLLCDPSATAPGPTFVSYTSGRVSLEWASPHACPRSGPAASPSEGNSGPSGTGFWGLLKFLFWLGVFALIAYFAIGVLYNHQQYSARGWDLVPHKDFWREFPLLISDLFGHLFAGLRGTGGGGRGGYSSLG